MKQNLIKENGRSMVEMLGVLAIVGVLSVAGIAGYRMAMAQHKANQIWQDVMTAATLIRGIPGYDSGSDEVAGEVEFATLENAGVSGYAIEGNIQAAKNASGAFQIKVSGVPQDVCERAIQMRPNEMVAIMPNGYDSTVCTDGNNEMWFVFDAIKGLCSSICTEWYEDWRKHCGSSWDWCNPSFGFYCGVAGGYGMCADSNSFEVTCFARFYYTAYEPNMQWYYTHDGTPPFYDYYFVCK